MAKLFANSGDPEHMPHSAASDLGLHCLPITFLQVSRLQWVKAALKGKKSWKVYFFIGHANKASRCHTGVRFSIHPSSSCLSLCLSTLRQSYCFAHFQIFITPTHNYLAYTFSLIWNETVHYYLWLWCLNIAQRGYQVLPFFLLCPAAKKVAGYYVIPSEILSVHLSVSGPTIRLPATRPTVLGQSFWNFIGSLRMVWRYAYCFFRILRFIFYHYFFIFNLDFFRALILQKCIGSMYLLPATPPTILGQSLSNFTGALGWSEDMHIVFSESWNYFLSHFFHF